MKLINPSEISARILTLLDESDQWVILVSPYMKISKWYKFLKKVNELKTRNISAEIYVRDDPDNETTYRDLDKLALRFKKIPNLHSKFYLNERYGIVTSMNLLLSSEINSLEIGYVTENRTEYNELLHYYHRYIQIGEPLYRETIGSEPVADLKELMHMISENLKCASKNSWTWVGENKLHISTGRNNYSISIIDGILNITAFLRIGSVLKQKGKQRSSVAKKIENLTAMKVDVHPCSTPEILQLSGQAPRILRSSCINGILKADNAYIVESVRSFIEVSEHLAG